MNTKVQKITALLMFVVIALGSIGFLSYSGFLKHVGWSLLKGYEATVPEDERSYAGRIEYYKSTITSSISDTVDKNHFYINVNGLMQRLLGANLVYDADSDSNVIKLDNGWLAFSIAEFDALPCADRIAGLRDYTEEKGIDFLYVQTPYKICSYESFLPPVVDDYSNANTDELLSRLNEHEVEYIDLRQEFHDRGADHYALYFRTDHHWKPETAFAACDIVMQRLSENYGFQYIEDHHRIENYNVEVYENIFLGSQGNRVGRFYGGLDNISIITPRFDTDFYFCVPEYTPGFDIVRNGSFADTMFDYTHINTEDPFADSPYAAYIGGNYALNIIVNNNTESDKKILFIRDSYSCVFTPFLALNCKELHAIDLRNYSGGTIREYIDEFSPDLVLMMYNPGALAEENLSMFELD